MDQKPLESYGGLAFAVAVFAVYFAIFSSLEDILLFDLLLLIGLGIAYISVGIYGYAYCSDIKSLPLSLTYFLIQLLLGGTFIYISKGISLSFLLLIPVACQSVVLLEKKWAYFVNAVIFLSYAITFNFLAVPSDDPWSTTSTFLAGQIILIFFTQMAVGEIQSKKEIERLAEELKSANQHLREYALQIEELAIAKERNRLAREIHDGLGHYLTTIIMQLQAADAIMKFDHEKGKSSLNAARSLAKDALDDVRNSVAALRANPEDGFTLPHQIDKILKDCSMFGITPNLEIIGEIRQMEPQTQLTIYRTIQEAVSNACKHSEAENIWVNLSFVENNKIKIIVKDDGIGSQTANGGFGLIGIRERVHLLDGTLDVVTSSGKGFSIEVELPG
jgi:signal transduction histidine kinase